MRSARCLVVGAVDARRTGWAFRFRVTILLVVLAIISIVAYYTAEKKPDLELQVWTQEGGVVMLRVSVPQDAGAGMEFLADKPPDGGSSLTATRSRDGALVFDAVGFVRGEADAAELVLTITTSRPLPVEIGAPGPIRKDGERVAYQPRYVCGPGSHQFVVGPAGGRDDGR